MYPMSLESFGCDVSYNRGLMTTCRFWHQTTFRVHEKGEIECLPMLAFGVFLQPVGLGGIISATENDKLT